MKVYISMLVGLIVIGGVFIAVSTKSGETELIKSEETSESVAVYQGESEEPAEVDYTQFNQLTSADSVPTEDSYIYFYQPECSHCKLVAPTLEDFSKEHNLYLVDMTLEENSELWADEMSAENVKTIADFQINGTPEMFELKDGQVINSYVGSDEILAITNS